MNCKVCGAQNAEEINFCNVCGARLDQLNNNAQAQQPNNNQYANPQEYQVPIYNQQPNGVNNGVDPQIIGKGENAKTLGIIGIIIGLFIPIIGWILGGIGMSNAGKAFAVTNDAKYKTSKNICIGAIVAGCVSCIFNVIIVVGSMSAYMYL